MNRCVPPTNSRTRPTIPVLRRSTWVTARRGRAWPAITSPRSKLSLPPRRLHSAQQIRTANFVLQSADPSGINAAGPGSNVGQSVVYRFAGEILRRAWEQTRDEKYLAALEDKAEKISGGAPEVQR